MNIRFVAAMGWILPGLIAGPALPAENSDESGPDPPAYQYHSLMLVKPLSAAELPGFLRWGFDIVETLPDGSLKIIAAPAEREELMARYGAQVEIENLEEYYRRGLDPGRDMGGYHTYSETCSELYQASFDSLARLDTIGYSIEGRAIFALKISDNVEVEEDEPGVFINGLTHAREAITVEIVLYFMWYLLDNYGTEPEIKALVDSTEIWLAPIVNPDGWVYNELTNPDGGGMWRKNRRDNGDGSFGVDLNRNWGFLWGLDNIGSSPNPWSSTYRGTGPFSEPETQALRDFINAHDFSVTVNYHSKGGMYVKPWGFNRDQGCPDDRIFYWMLDSLFGYSGYDTTQSLYVTNGSAYDWQYGEQFEKEKAFAFVAEVGPSFWPPSSAIDSLCEDHLQPNLFFLREAQRLRNRPTRSLATEFTHFDTTVDRCSDDFSVGRVYWNVSSEASFDVQVSHFDSMASGAWFSMDTFTIRVGPQESFDALMHFSPNEVGSFPDGQYPHTGCVRVVFSGLGSLAVVDTLLFPVKVVIQVSGADITPSFIAEPTRVPVLTPVQFTNTSTTFDSCLWDFGDGKISTDVNPEHCYDSSGMYSVKLVCYSNCYVDSITYMDYVEVHCCRARGNVDGDGGINVADLTYLANHIFFGGDPPPCLLEGDCDGSGAVNVADLTCLADYLFFDGPTPPPCD